MYNNPGRHQKLLPLPLPFLYFYSFSFPPYSSLISYFLSPIRASEKVLTTGKFLVSRHLKSCSGSRTESCYYERRSSASSCLPARRCGALAGRRLKMTSTSVMVRGNAASVILVTWLAFVVPVKVGDYMAMVLGIIVVSE